jgi:hypothetical protein
MKRLPPFFLLLFLVLLLALPSMAAAQHVGAYLQPQPDAAASAGRVAAAAAAPHVAERYGVRALAELGTSAVEAPDLIAAVRTWNESHHRPLRNGFERPLPAPRHVDMGAALAAAGPVTAQGGGLLVQTSLSEVAWGGSVRVAGAHRLRLHLARVRLPQGTRIWVHGGGQTAGPFGPEVAGADGSLWTPSVAGEELALDVQLPAGALTGQAGYGFTIDRVVELMDLGTVDAAAQPKDMSCNMDAMCFTSADFPAIETVRHAIALIEFVDSGFSGQCTGELLNDVNQDGIPYMLTANHCISTPAGANSLEAWWDYYTPSCNAAMPALGPQPTSVGANLLATADANTSSDYTLMQLDNIPSGRGFLGWNANASDVPDGTLLYRLSYPEGQTQNYNVTKVDSTTVQCSPQLPPNFVYSDLVIGGTFAGSSGSAAMLSNGEVVGQLYGGCGSSDDCSPQQYTLDGAFAHSFPALQPYLAAGGGPPTVCRPDKNTLCLLSRRFQVQVAWTNQFNGSSGVGGAIVGTDNTGYFFFTDAANYELIIKILDISGAIKVFYGELTDLMFTITVSDTVSGETKTYSNTPGDCGAIDENAFPAAASAAGAAAAAPAGSAALGAAASAAASGQAGPPLPAATALPAVALAKGTCRPSSNTLCLLNHRFAVTTNWMNQFNDTSGIGAPKPLSDQSGLFTFADPTVVELVLKVVQFTDRVAFYYAALSDFQYSITVTDTVGGSSKTYQNPAGTYCGGLDNSAFPP